MNSDNLSVPETINVSYALSDIAQFFIYTSVPG